MALASPAAAAPGVLVGGTCTVLPTLGASCAPGARCAIDGGGSGTCLNVGSLSLCLPDDAVLCCTEDRDCPADPAAGVGVCVPVSSVAVCAVGPDYCAGGARPTTMQIANCHRDGGGPLVVWDRGDCDMDGIRNGDEVEAGSDPCRGPLPYAVWSGTTCHELPIGCDPRGTCTTPLGDAGECRLTDDGGGTTCFPMTSELYCGDGVWVCPSGQIEVDDTTLRHTFCTPPYCDPRVTPSDCVRDPVSRQPVRPEDGDCDGDGIPNGAERDDSRICVVDVTELDGGTTPVDAGVPGLDAGDTLPDAGDVPPDAGDAPADAAVTPMDGGEG
ncbi:MAG: hypothetical protein KC619_27140, partial [Myxococcales bacterium]|nr:hypothetical protein [Myxococcales bacterium]